MKQIRNMPYPRDGKSDVLIPKIFLPSSDKSGHSCYRYSYIIDFFYMDHGDVHFIVKDIKLKLKIIKINENNLNE